ncbi:unnamed protein product, partial [Ectocarpus sp. 8 AP-2014]
MRLLGGLLFAVGVAPLLQLTRAQAPDGGIPSATRNVWTRFAEEDVSDVGVGEVHPIASDEEEIEQELVAALESDPQATVVVQIGLGELLCDSLEDASDSTLLRFNISSTEAVIAERTSYSSIDGNVFPDGETRKIWMGEVVDPEPPAGSAPRTVSMTWTDPCGVESFLLSVVSHNNDGSTSIVRSIPCAAGSSSEVCMVELAVVFNDGDSAVDSTSADIDDDDFESVTLENPGESVEEQEGRMLKTIRAPTKSGGKESLHSRGSPGSRELQSDTQIDFLVLYTPEAYLLRSGTESQLLSMIGAAVDPMNLATSNSEIELDFNLVGVEQLPYNQMLDDTTDYNPELEAMTGNAAVAALRDQYEADLVLLVGYFPNTCGLGWIFNFNEALGFSLMDSICFLNWTQTHEFGHNLGCRHDRDNSNTGTTEYGHGLRYCTGTPQYRTVMTYWNDCTGAELINYFSNPDVEYLGQPTGTATENNAQTVKDNMVDVSLFRPLICSDGEACASCLAAGTPASVGDGICDA